VLLAWGLQNAANVLVEARRLRLFQYVIRAYEASCNENPVARSGK
jgi:hypothetical protein